MMLYLWLDPTVYKAYKVPHLPLEQLPPLADYDSSSHLVKRTFKHLDPFKTKSRRHLFFGLMTVFRKEYMVLALMLAIQNVTSFAGPLAIKNLLRYLETDGVGASVRPWLWISWLLIGPVIGSVAIQWYIFTTTRMLVRTTGIITQLIFAHSLRVRMKAEVSDSPTGSTVTTAVGTPDNASIAETDGAHSQSQTEAEAGNHSPASSEDETVRASISGSTTSTKDNRKSKAPSELGEGKKQETKKSDSSAGNLVGKINNLVTTDLDNLINGRDFMFIGQWIGSTSD